ncbi:MAG: hypothetical protein E7390_10375 [Ruminococcaceae bacterium]|nr:hypothetical protein [Oscillospiraceae bacterium]
MDKKEYISRCQKVSVLPQGVGGIKQNVPDELCVLYKGLKLYPHAYMLAFDEVTGEPIHVAVLHDMDVNSIRHVDLAKVEGVAT